MPKAAEKSELIIAGPAGALQAMLETPEAARSDALAIVCHPHPQHQGTMHNKVVHTLVRAFNELGLPALRFNFRGVGNSAGAYGGGAGETDDLLAVADYVRREWPEVSIWLAGFSFGAVVAARASVRVGAVRLVCVAPAVNVLGENLHDRPTMPWLIVQGDEDEIVPIDEVRAWVAANQPGPELMELSGVGHFFHGALVELRRLIVDKCGSGADNGAAGK